MNKLTLAVYFDYAFNGEDLGKTGAARDELAEFVLAWLAKEGVGVSIPAVRGGDVGQLGGVRTAVLQAGM